MTNKVKLRFNVGDLLPIGLTLVVLGIGLTYSLNVMEDVQDDVGETSCASGYWNETSHVCQASSTNATQVEGNSAAFNASNDAIVGVGKLPEKLTLIVTVIVAAVIIGVLVRYLMVRY